MRGGAAECVSGANSRCESTRGWLPRCQRAWADRLTSWQQAGPRPPDTSLSDGPGLSRNSFALVSCLPASLPPLPFGVLHSRLFPLPWSSRSIHPTGFSSCGDFDFQRGNLVNGEEVDSGRGCRCWWSRRVAIGCVEGLEVFVIGSASVCTKPELKGLVDGCYFVIWLF